MDQSPPISTLSVEATGMSSHSPSPLPASGHNSPILLDPAEPSTRIPRPSTLPRKGILKRSGSASTPKRGHSTPPDQSNLPSATSLSDIRNAGIHGSYRSIGRSASAVGSTPRAGSKIPKLSVTWWETNSICGEAPPSIKSGRSSKHFSPPPLPEEIGRGSDEENDDVESIQSGVSSIVGSWWFGRTTRYVPHCERRHLHHDDCGQYLTPTQRKNREIGELKQELRRSQKLVDDKEHHLQQLRDRLTELERIMDQGGCLVENQRLQSKLRVFQDEADREKRRLASEYEERLKRLKAAHDRDSTERETTFQFELDELRSTLDREQQQKTAAITADDHDSGMSSSGLGFGAITTTDAATMTDQQSDAQELQAYRYECMVLRSRVSELDFANKQYEKDLATEEACGNKACVTRQRAQSAQLEAYKNECLVWRTKAAEMEIALKQQVALKNNLQLQVQNLQHSLRQAHERQLQLGHRLRSSSSLSSLTKCSLDDIQALLGSPAKDDLALLLKDDNNESGIVELTSEEQSFKKEFLQMRNKAKYLEKQLESTKKQLKTTIGHLKAPCSKEKCVTERKSLNSENEQLKREVGALRETNETLERQFNDSKHRAAEREEILKTSEQVIQSMDQQLTSKRTELEVTQLTLQKLKEENEKLHSEVQDLNGKLANLESIMADCGVIVVTPSSSAGTVRRKAMRGGQQPQQLVYRGREVQTDLTWMEETKMENDLKDLLERYAVLQAKYDEEKADLEMKLDEISQNLQLKNSLVGTLTNQIQMLNDEYEAARAGFERERLQYSQKLHDLDLIAQRVPFLETDVATAREEVQLAESSYEKEKGRFERAMEDSLTETMKTHQQTAEYWKAKLEQSLKQTEFHKRRCDQAQQELSDAKMRLNLDKIELERKLEKVYDELSTLQKRIYMDRETRSTQTFFPTEEKGVSCYVKMDPKETEILQGDLFDERDERLRMLQGELQATRRQVEILQGKLLINESVYQQLEEADVQKKDSDETIADLKEELETMKADCRVERELFEAKCAGLAAEKERMILAEQERIGQLELAFEHVRHELDAVIKRYEMEKFELQTKIEHKCAEFERAYNDKSALEDETMELRQSLEEHVKTSTDLQAALVEKIAEIFALEEQLKNLEAQLEAEQGTKTKELVDLTELERQIREMSCECDVIVVDDEAKKKWNAWKQEKRAIGEGEKGKRRCPVHDPETPATTQSATTEGLEVNEEVRSEEATPIPDILAAWVESKETSPATKAAILDMRAKVLFLLQENQQLRSEFNDMKESVSSLIKRHDSLKRQRPAAYDNGPAAVQASKAEETPVQGISKIQEEEFVLADASTEKAVLEELQGADDLDAIKDDLAHIAHRFELLTDDARVSAANEEAMLMQWLKHEMKKEKCELDVLIKWYESDRRKLENEVADLKQQLQATKDKVAIAQMELEYVLVDLHDTGRELELYKLEDSNSIRKQQKRGGLRKCKSQGQLSSVETKSYQNGLTRDYFAIQKKCNVLAKERDQLQQELNILRVDHTLLEIERDARNEEKKSKDKPEADELEHLKHQLHQAERCAARLENEATQWMTEVAMLKGQIRAKNRIGRGSRMASTSSLDSVGAPSGDGPVDLAKELKKSEQNVAKLEVEVAQYSQQCIDLKKQLATTVAKQGYLMRRQQQEIDRLRDRHENEMRTVQKALTQLRPSTKVVALPVEKDQVLADLRQILDDTTISLIDKSQELERLERDVIYLKARLAEASFKDAPSLAARGGESQNCGADVDELSISSFAAFMENLKVKHEIELKTLRQELMEERSKRLGTKSEPKLHLQQQPSFEAQANGAEPGLSGKGPVKGPDGVKHIDDSGSGSQTSISAKENGISLEAEELRNRCQEAQLLLRKEQHKVEEMDEKYGRIEKELKMVNEELRLKSIHFKEEIARLTAENENLRTHQETAPSDPSVDRDTSNYAKMETAVATARTLQERVDQLVAELEQREKQHQEMYLLMFRKGQEAAKMDMATSMELDGGDGSTSSSEWSFEVRGEGREGSASGRKTENVAQHQADAKMEHCLKLESTSKGGSPGLSKEEIVLQFLRDAVYYFLMNRDAKDHLQAIMSILKFSEHQRHDVLKAKGFG